MGHTNVPSEATTPAGSSGSKVSVQFRPPMCEWTDAENSDRSAEVSGIVDGCLSLSFEAARGEQASGQMPTICVVAADADVAARGTAILFAGVEFAVAELRGV